MAKRLANTVILFCVLGTSALTCAQVVLQPQCPYTTHALSLACLIPDTTQAGKSQNLARFNTTIAQVLGQLPLAAPVSGFVVGFDKATGQFVPLNENLGSVLTERGNTVGRHNIFVAFTAQRFVFQTIDGIKLSSLPTVGQYGTIPLGGNATAYEFESSTNSLSANLNQYTGIIAVGLTDKIDLSVTVPFERVSLSGGYANLTQTFVSYNSSGAAVGGGNLPLLTNQSSQVRVPGSASGFGDVLVNMKGTIIDAEKSKVALGAEARFPTGDEYNLLGTGAYGIKPYIVYSRLGRITPHANLGYQWNSFSNLYVNPCYFLASTDPHSCPPSNLPGAGVPSLKLPPSLDYSAGVDAGITKWLTVVGDFVGQRYFNSPVVTAPAPAGGTVPFVPNCSAGSPAPAACTASPAVAALSSARTVGVTTGSISVDNVALGLKIKPIGHLIISANALIRLDDGGLRPDRFVPLVGISYSFGK
jgi:hypothetical protein